MKRKPTIREARAATFASAQEELLAFEMGMAYRNARRRYALLCIETAKGTDREAAALRAAGVRRMP